MSEELRLKAGIAEIEAQRNWALTRCAQLSAEVELLKDALTKAAAAQQPKDPGDDKPAA